MLRARAADLKTLSYFISYPQFLVPVTLGCLLPPSIPTPNTHRILSSIFPGMPPCFDINLTDPPAALLFLSLGLSWSWQPTAIDILHLIINIFIIIMFQCCQINCAFIWWFLHTISPRNQFIGFIFFNMCVSHLVVSDSLWPHGL